MCISVFLALESGDITIAQEQHRILATIYTNFSLQWATALRQIILLSSSTELESENQAEAAILPENEINTVQLMDVSLKPVVLDAPLQPMTSDEPTLLLKEPIPSSDALLLDEPIPSSDALLLDEPIPSNDALLLNEPITLNEPIPSNLINTNEISVASIQLSAIPIQTPEPIPIENTANQPLEENQANSTGSSKPKPGRFGRILHL